MTPEAIKAVREALNLAPEPDRDDTVYYHWFRDDRSKALALLAAEQAKASPDKAEQHRHYMRGYNAATKNYLNRIAELEAKSSKAPPDWNEIEEMAKRLDRYSLLSWDDQELFRKDLASLLRRLSPVTAGEWQPIETAIKRLRAEMDDIDRFITPLSEADPTNPNGDKCLPAYRFSSGAWMMLRARILHVLEALPPSPKEAGR